MAPRGSGRLPILPKIAPEEADLHGGSRGVAGGRPEDRLPAPGVCHEYPKVPSDKPDLPGLEDPTVTPLDPPMGIVEVQVLRVLVLLTVVLAGLGCWVILRRGGRVAGLE